MKPLTTIQLETLRTIARLGQPTFRELKIEFGVTQNAIHTRLRALKEKGMLEFEAHVHHHHRFVITEAGWNAVGVTACPHCGTRILS